MFEQLNTGNSIGGLYLVWIELLWSRDDFWSYTILSIANFVRNIVSRKKFIFILYALRSNQKLNAPCSVLNSDMRNSAMLKLFVLYFQSFLGINVVSCVCCVMYDVMWDVTCDRSPEQSVSQTMRTRASPWEPRTIEDHLHLYTWGFTLSELHVSNMQ